MVRDAIEQCGCHLGIAKDRDPLTELQVGRDDDAGLLIQLADQMEEQREQKMTIRRTLKLPSALQTQ